MKKIHFTLITMLLSTGHSYAKEEVVSGPDGKLQITVSDSRNSPSFKIDYNGKSFLKDSPLGLNTNVGDFTKGLKMSGEPRKRSISDYYELPNIKHSSVNYNANEAVYTFCDNNGKPAIDIIFRISNNDIAFRYMVHSRGDSLSCIINEEATGYVMPDGTTTFLCPQSGPMGGFARTSPSYETPYTTEAPTGENGWGLGYTFPCLFRNGENGWLLLSETGVDSRYCGSRLIGHPNGLYTIGFPQEGENNGNGTVSPGIKLPGYTPWRTITIGETLAPIVETTIPFDVVEPLYEASREYKYCRGSWSWIIGMDESVCYEDQKRYIDFSSAMGYEFVLVDNWWDKQIGRDKIVELANYAKSKNVGFFLWYNSNGYWSDAPQTPRQCMNNLRSRRDEMRWLKEVGIEGIKVDFFGGDKQVTMELYEDILTEANEHGLKVIFHGCTIPRGRERMFPNFVSSEAVLASENLYFSQGSCDYEAFNACLHPFIRNTIGNMDFGGSALNKYYNKHNSPENSTVRKTSDVFALSTAVLFQSCVQHFAMAPNNITDAPMWAINFMKEVPTTWDETRFIDGYPGKYVILARRKDDTWYITGVNAMETTLKINLNLPMLNAARSTRIYSDNDKLEGSLSNLKVNKKKEVSVTIPANGGVLIVN